MLLQIFDSGPLEKWTTEQTLITRRFIAKSEFSVMLKARSITINDKS